MKNKVPFRLAAFATLALAALVLPAQAQARIRSTTVTRSPGHYNKSTSVTNNAGQTTSRSVSRNVDPATGKVTGTSSTTWPNGKVSTRTTESEKTATGRTTTTERTGANGKTSSAQSTTTKTAEGHTRDVSATGRNDGTATKHVEVKHADGTTTKTVTTRKTPPPSTP